MNLFSNLIRCIKSIAEKVKKKSNSIHYTVNTEIETGDIWIDNKPIYLYVQSHIVTNVGNSAIYIPIPNELNIDTIIDYKLLFFHSNKQWGIVVTYNSNGASTLYYDTNTNSDRVWRIAHQQSNRLNQTEYIIFKYTKITD